MVTPTTNDAAANSSPKYSLAILGTGSDVGKSILAAGICRILSNQGVSVAPFKAQNMSNNAYPALRSDSGNQYGEIGIAQAIQARACRQVPRVEMNPVLLKSGGKRESDGAYLCSVFVLGQHYTTEDYGALGERTETLLDLVVRAYHRLPADTVILEGAGSCTELNLMDRDIVNLPLVRRLQSPWLLVANIDPGGVFAQIVGTKACLSTEDWDLCVGVVVNKLRGEVKYFEPGPRILQEMVGKPIFVVPYLSDINIAEEDGMGLERKLTKEGTIDETHSGKVRVVVICYPHISMTDDLLPLEHDSRFQVEWRRKCLPELDPAAIILPGSRQTRLDMDWLAASPWYSYLVDYAQGGGKLLGICGGYQMLGQRIADPLGIESGNPGVSSGLGLLPVTTTLDSSKIVKKVNAAIFLTDPSIVVHGFEIHSGQTFVDTKTCSASGSRLLQMEDSSFEGWACGFVAGTYIHGILESKAFRDYYFGLLKHHSCTKSIDPLDRLAGHLIEHGLDFRVLSAMIGYCPCKSRH